jgi:hypothetical protein
VEKEEFLMSKKKPNSRKDPRPSLMAPANLVLTEEDSFLEAYTVNVSYSGIGLYIQRPLSTNTKVQTNISFIDPAGEEVIEEIIGSVIWCRPVRRWFGVGIKNKNLESKKHPILLSYLEQN